MNRKAGCRGRAEGPCLQNGHLLWLSQNSCTHNQVFTGRRLEDSPDSGYEKTHL